MTSNEKIIVGSTAIIGAAAITLLIMGKKYEKMTDEIYSEISEVRYILSKSREDLIVINKETAEGNKILRKLIKESAENGTNTPTTKLASK